MSVLKLQCIWLIDLASNFRKHLLIVGISTLVIGIVLSIQTYFILVSFIALLFAVLPLSSCSTEKKLLPADVLKSFVITSYNIQRDIDNHVRSLEFIEKCQSDIIILQEVTAETRTIINGFKDRFPCNKGSRLGFYASD